jgi:hypothetical protein
MSRLALLGDSHLSNWKRAWPLVGAEFPTVEPVYFAAAGKGLEGCQPKSDRLVFESEELANMIQLTSGGRRELVVADYDAFCVVGLRSGVRIAIELYARWRADSHRRQDGRFQIVSDACFLDTVYDQLDASLAMTVVRKLRSITDKPIFLAARPAYSENALDDARFNDMKVALDAGDAQALRATYDTATRRLTDSGVVILDQPGVTLASPVLSKSVYQREGGDVPDVLHMNDAFGEIAVRELLARLLSEVPAMTAPDAAVGREAPKAGERGDRQEPSFWTSLKRSIGTTFLGRSSR